MAVFASVELLVDTLGGCSGRIMAMNCAEFRIRRTSLKEGATKRREEMARCWSWVMNAASRWSGVRKEAIVGTSILSLEVG